MGESYVRRLLIKTQHWVLLRYLSYRLLPRYGVYGLLLFTLLQFILFAQNYLTNKNVTNSITAYNQIIHHSHQTQLKNIQNGARDLDSHYWRNQTIGGTFDIFIFSAHMDTRDHSRFIRVLGIAGHKFKHSKVSCVAVDKEDRVLVLDVDVRQNKEHFGLKFSSYFFNCNAIHYVNFNPVKVGIVEYGKYSRGVTASSLINMTWVSVLNQQQEDWRGISITGGVAVCVKPLYNHYDRSVWLLEFIELYTLLGVEHFYFYNHSVGGAVEAVLRHYQKQKRVTVLPWELPLVSQKQVRTEGQFTALNDCNYRTMYRFKYVVIVDLDEYIIPTKHFNYTGLLAEIDKKQFGTFIFQNCFFYIYWENDTRVESQASHTDPMIKYPYLITLYKTRRLVQTHRHGTRSKYIVKPHRVVEVGNHNVWSFIRGSRTMKAGPELGLSHHYRICEFGGRGCLSKASKVDNTTHRWAGPLLTAVLRRCQLIFEANICPEDPSYEDGKFS